MTLSTLENITASFTFAKEAFLSHWLHWIILAVIIGMLDIIPSMDLTDPTIRFSLFLVSLFCLCVLFMVYGYAVQILRGGDTAPELKGYGHLFVDGIIVSIIQVVYLVLGAIISLFFFLLLMIGVTILEGEAAVNEMMPLLEDVGIIFVVLGLLVGYLFFVFGAIRFAKTDRFREGINFEAVIATIDDVGWGHYLCSFLALALVFFGVLLLITVVIVLIPPLEWIILNLVVILFLVWGAKFSENLYSQA